jgi:hypothetical protein
MRLVHQFEVKVVLDTKLDSHYIRNSNRRQIGDTPKGNHLRSRKTRCAHTTEVRT